jgi:hypothetical protein
MYKADRAMLIWYTTSVPHIEVDTFISAFQLAVNATKCGKSHLGLNNYLQAGA